ICYGMQMLAVQRGIPLVVDLNAEFGIPNRRELRDRVHLILHSLANSIFSERLLAGFENHHQAVDIREFARLKPPAVRITGTSNGGIVPEAIEFDDRPMALGVQFHPEGSALALSDRVFGWLLDQARLRSARHHR